MNKNGKKMGIFSFLLFLLTALFTLASGNASAEETTPTVSVTGKFADTITIVNVTNNEGGDLNQNLEQWATLSINATYEPPTTEGQSTVVTTEKTAITEGKNELPNTSTTNYNHLVVIASVLLVGAYLIVRKELK